VPKHKALSEHKKDLKKDLKKADDGTGGPDGSTPSSARAPRAPRKPASRATKGRASGGCGKASGGAGVSSHKRLRPNDSDVDSDDERGPCQVVPKREADALAADGNGASMGAGTATPRCSQRVASIRVSDVIKRMASESMASKSKEPDNQAPPYTQPGLQS
jgi:hypothetical protein